MLVKTLINNNSQAVVAHDFNPSTQEAEAGGFLNSRPAYSTKPELTQRNTVSNNNNKDNGDNNNKWLSTVCLQIWAGEMGKSTSCSSRGLSSIPSTHIVFQTCLPLQCLFWSLWALHTCGTQTYMQAKYPET